MFLYQPYFTFNQGKKHFPETNEVTTIEMYKGLWWISTNTTEGGIFLWEVSFHYDKSMCMEVFCYRKTVWIVYCAF